MTLIDNTPSVPQYSWPWYITPSCTWKQHGDTWTCDYGTESRGPQTPAMREPWVEQVFTKPKIDKFLLLHTLAASYDGATTKYFLNNCPRCYEAEPISRALLGRRPSSARMIATGAASILGVSCIKNPKLRHLTQLALIAGHLYFGSRNLIRTK